jgi:16S rRNA processing protein RimM
MSENVGEEGRRGSAAACGDDLVAIGMVRRPVGLKGWCYVEALGETLPALQLPGSLRAGRDPASTRDLVLREKKNSPQGLVCKFEGIDDVDTAGTLRGLYLFCGRDCLAPLPGARHYHFELEGLTVVGADSGRTIGLVAAIQNFPTTDALEVRKEDGTTILISMTQGIIRSVDQAGGVIAVSDSAIEEIL